MLHLEQHQIFIDNIYHKRKMNVKFHSNKTKKVENREVAPLDYWKLSRSKNNKEYYFVWDFQGTNKPHPIPLSSEKIIDIYTIDDKFNPDLFIDWDISKNPWKIERNW